MSSINKQIDTLIALKMDDAIANSTFTERVRQLEAKLAEHKEFIQEEPKKPDLKGFIKMAKKILLKPAEVWQESSFQVQKKLQVFYFPQGVIYDGKKCQTPETCILFRLKSDFDAFLSCNVPLRNVKTNTRDNESFSLINAEEIIRELEQLKQILA